MKLFLVGLRTCLILIGTFTISAIGTAHADLIKVTFSGDIDIAYDDGPLLGTTSISDSSSFTGTFTYDTDATPTSTFPYNDNYSTLDFNITIDGIYAFNWDDPGASVSNDQPTLPSGYLDEISAGGYTNSDANLPFSTSNVNVIYWGGGANLEDWTGTALNNTSLPNTIDLADFDTREIFIYVDYSDLAYQYAYGLTIMGTINNLDTAPIPEPATMLLFGTGLAGLVAVGRRRKK